MAVSNRKIKTYGLSEVYVCPGPQKPLVDIVLVHGLNGNPQKTWTSSSGVFWPADLLPQFVQNQRVRVLVWGYNSTPASFTDSVSQDNVLHHAETLVANLSSNRSLNDCMERPIIFICHSLGGLVVKRAIITSRNVENEKTEHWRSVYISTYGILFLGTPHLGSELAKWGLLLQKICTVVLPKKFFDSTPHLIEALKTNNQQLQNINRLFTETTSRFHIYFFHETLPMELKGHRELIVDESSAAPDVEGVERSGIEADHSHMCKFDDVDSPGFVEVAEAVKRYSSNAPTLIATRWGEEKKERQAHRRAKASELYTEAEDLPSVSVTQSPRNYGVSVVPVKRPLLTANNSNPEDLASSTGSLASLTTQRLPLFVAPPGFHPNSVFYGMQRELEVLHTRLFRAKRRAKSLVSVLVCGPRGCGKTHLARQYVHERRDDYPGGVFWVDAKSLQSRLKCFWDIAQAARLTDEGEFQYPGTGAETYVEAVRGWLQRWDQWLLVFDGISFEDDGDAINSFKRFLPFNSNCAIIYTSYDQTLSKKERLFEPYRLLVKPLSVEDARKLLLKGIGIKKPTSEQLDKATKIVEHYECLPLAIHAIGHRLNANRRPLEKYHIGSHLTDIKLAEPFLNIMHDLYRQRKLEALNLLNLLSFFSHHIPLGLINWGRPALEEWNVSVLSSSRLGEYGDIDTTIGTLIRYGLIERVLTPYPTTGSTAGIPSISEKDTISTLESSDSFTEHSQGSSKAIYQSSIDVIKIHSVVQEFCRDELRMMDEEIRKASAGQRGRSPTSASQKAGYYHSWLIVAIRVFCQSYGTAKNKMRHAQSSGFVRDYREYETHGQRLLEYYSKKPQPQRRPTILVDARHQLDEVMKNIGKEIEKISPNASEESLQHEKSIFDRSSSSSSGPESSSPEEAQSRRSTWTPDDEASIHHEPPRVVRPPSKVRLDHFPPHIYRESSEEQDDGYQTDRDDMPTLQHTSPTPSQMSQSTEKPGIANQLELHSEDDKGWEVVQRLPKPRPLAPRPRRGGRGKLNRDLGEYRRIPALTKLSSLQGTGLSSRDHNTPQRLTEVKGADAKSHLQAVHNATPLPTTLSGITNRAFSLWPKPKENQRSYANVAAQKSPPRSVVPSPPISIPTPDENTPPVIIPPSLPNVSDDSYSLVSGDARPSLSLPVEIDHDRNPLSQSDPCLGPGSLPRDIITHSAPGSRSHSRTSTGAMNHDQLKLLSAGLSNNLTRKNIANVPYNERIVLTSNPRLGSLPESSQPDTALRDSSGSRSRISSAHPSAIMPGTSPPSGYMSEPADLSSLPMSRDASAQSRDSWYTEPGTVSSIIGSRPMSTSFIREHEAVPPNFPSKVMSRRFDSGLISSSDPNALVAPAISVSYTTRYELGGEPGVSNAIGFTELPTDTAQTRQHIYDWEEHGIPRPSAITTIKNPSRSAVLPSQDAPIRPRSRSGSAPKQPNQGLGLDIRW